MAKFGDAERKIKSLLSEGTSFLYDNETYSVLVCDKPTCYKGEPKTDIYVLAKDHVGQSREFKISYKKPNADFLENKTNAERAELLFGNSWEDIVTTATTALSTAFDNKKLVYKKSGGRTEEGAITLGWKFELLNKSGGELSGEMNLSRTQIIDVYAGTHLPEDKANAYVNGNQVKNSGVANYIIMNDNINTAQEVFDNIYTIDEYVDKYPKIYFACKALNYRTKKQKFDGNRPLSVYVNWYAENGKLKHELVYDTPLVTKGNAVCEKLLKAMSALGIKTTDDITESNIDDYKIVND